LEFQVSSKGRGAAVLTRVSAAQNAARNAGRPRTTSGAQLLAGGAARVYTVGGEAGALAIIAGKTPEVIRSS